MYAKGRVFLFFLLLALFLPGQASDLASKENRPLLLELQNKIAEYLLTPTGREKGYLPGWSTTKMAPEMLNLSDIIASYQAFMGAGREGSSPPLSQFIGNLSATHQLYNLGLTGEPDEQRTKEIKNKLFLLFSELRDRLDRGAIPASDFEDIKLSNEVRRAIAGVPPPAGETSSRDLEINLTSSEIEVLLDSGRYALISAGRNSNHEEDSKMTNEEVAARYEKLRRDLIRRGYNFTRVTGYYYGKEEDSFLVMANDLDLQDILRLGEQYNQEAIIYADGGAQEMHFTTGEKKNKSFKGKGWSKTSSTQDFYSVINSANGVDIKFSLRFDFEEVNPLPQQNNQDYLIRSNNAGVPPPAEESEWKNERQNNLSIEDYRALLLEQSHRVTHEDQAPFILEAEQSKGVVLLLHGLGDSPGKVRGLANIYHQQGYTVVAPLMSGHGTNVQDLANVRYQDWQNDFDQAIHAAQELNNGNPVHVVGYSNGGNISIDGHQRHADKFASLTLLAPLLDLNSVLHKYTLPLTQYFRPFSPPHGENTNIQYDQLSAKAVNEALKLTRANKEYWRNYQMNVPLNLIVTDADSVVSTARIGEFISRQNITAPNLLVFSKRDNVSHGQLLTDLLQGRPAMTSQQLEQAISNILGHGITKSPFSIYAKSPVELLNHFSNAENVQDFLNLTDDEKNYVIEEFHKLILSDDREVVEKVVHFFIEKDGRIQFYIDRYLIKQFNFPPDWRSGRKRDMVTTFASTVGSRLLMDAGGGLKTGRKMTILEAGAVVFDVIAHAYYGHNTRAPVAHYVAPGTPLGMGDFFPAIFLWTDLLARYMELAPAVEKLLNSIGLPLPGDPKTALEISIWYRKLEHSVSEFLTRNVAMDYAYLLELPRDEMAFEFLKKLVNDVLSFGIPAASTAITGSILGAPIGTITGGFLGISFGGGKGDQRSAPHLMDLDATLKTIDSFWRDLDCDSMTVRMLLHNNYEAENRHFLATSLLGDAAVLAVQGALFTGALSGGKVSARVTGQAFLSTTLGAKVAAASPLLAGIIRRLGLSRLGLYGAAAAPIAYYNQMIFDTGNWNVDIDELDEQTCRDRTDLGGYAIGDGKAPVMRGSFCAHQRLSQIDHSDPANADLAFLKSLECHTRSQDPDASNRSVYSHCDGGVVVDRGYQAMKMVKERCGNHMERCRDKRNFLTAKNPWERSELEKWLDRHFAREEVILSEAPIVTTLFGLNSPSSRVRNRHVAGTRTNRIPDEVISRIKEHANSKLGLDRSPLAVNDFYCKKEPEHCEDGIAFNSPYFDAIGRSILKLHPDLTLDDERLKNIQRQLYTQMIFAHKLHRLSEDEGVQEIIERLHQNLIENNDVQKYLAQRCHQEMFIDLLKEFMQEKEEETLQCHL